MKFCVVGIDASRNRSGGAKSHLVGLLEAGDPAEFGIGKVHVWAYHSLLDALPKVPWLVKHHPSALERSLLRQLWWQRFELPAEIRGQGCDILLSTDAGTIGTFEPSVVMSRDMLSYEPCEMRRYGISKAWMRLCGLRYIQARSLKRARGAIFLTRYAADTIQEFIGTLPNSVIIPHGISDAFRKNARVGRAAHEGATIRCVYVSNADLYKHQWHVARAVGELRKRGHDVILTLVGGGEGKAQRLIDAEVALIDPHGKFVRSVGAVAHEKLPAVLAESDLFVFASSCENMPNTLLEGMAGGLPIACSNRGPMPEVLQDGGVYFDPENSDSIAAALERLVSDTELRARVAQRARILSQQFSWTRCAKETWTFLRQNVSRWAEAQ